MNNLIKLLVVFFSFLMLTAHGDKVVATYGKDKKLTESEITRWIVLSTGGKMPEGKKTFSELSPNLKDDIIKQYVIQKELTEIADNSSIQKSEAFQHQLQSARDSLMIRLYLEKYADRHLTNNLLKAQYKKFVKVLKSSDDLEVSHIIVENETVANDAYKKLKKGHSFNELSKQYSKDKNGKNIKISRGQVLPEYESAAYKLKKGQFSKPVKTDLGWFIILLNDKQKKKIPSLEEVKPQLERMAKEEIINDYIKKLSKTSNIKLVN